MSDSVEECAEALKLDFDDKTKCASRVPTGVLPLAFALVPFV